MPTTASVRRPALALLAAGAAAIAAVPAVASAATRTAPAPTTLFESVRPATIVDGGVAHVSAHLVRSGTQTGVNGASIVLEARPTPTSGTAQAFTVVATATTATVGKTAGVATFSVAPAHNTQYVVVHKADAKYGASHSGTRNVGVRFDVSVQPGSQSVAKGGTVTLSVTVAPSAAGQRVSLRRYVNGQGWQVVAGRALAKTSATTFTVRPSGTTKYDVVKPATSANGAGSSKVVTITVA